MKNKAPLLLFCFSILFMQSCHKQDCNCSEVVFSKFYGGSKIDGFSQVITTSDGGYLTAGSTLSNDGDVSGNHGREDGFVLKLYRDGKIQWKKALGGSSTDVATSIVEASDGNYVLTGITYSNDGDVGSDRGNGDVWVLKLDKNGTVIWKKNYGGSAHDDASNIINSPDGGFVILGNTESNDGDVNGNHGNFDAWVLKLDRNGNKLWQKTFGGINFDIGQKITSSLEGGYILAGSTTSTDGDGGLIRGRDDGWVIKLDANGNKIWQRTYGGSNTDQFTSIAKTADGYILAGITTSSDGDVIGKHGGSSDSDAWVVRLDKNGSIIWQNALGESSVSYQARSAVTAPDGSTIVAGSRIDDGVSQSALLVKLDNNGNKIWQKLLGTGASFSSVIITPWNVYAMAGGAGANGAFGGSFETQDAWVTTIKN